ncbi:unnamed protein product, partial [Urochloa humidicola]
SYPFRRPRDPPECGVPAYELACSSSKATIHINTGTYFVTNINYPDSTFWVVDANLDMHTCNVGSLDPSCGYLAMIPVDYFSGWPVTTYTKLENASYTDIIKLIKKGFSVKFPLGVSFDRRSDSWSWVFKTCLNNSTRYFHKQLYGTSILNWTRALFWSEVTLGECGDHYSFSQNAMFRRIVL